MVWHKTMKVSIILQENKPCILGRVPSRFEGSGPQKSPPEALSRMGR